jgi:hypothetical protein
VTTPQGNSRRRFPVPPLVNFNRYNPEGNEPTYPDINNSSVRRLNFDQGDELPQQTTGSSRTCPIEVL